MSEYFPTPAQVGGNNVARRVVVVVLSDVVPIDRGAVVVAILNEVVVVVPSDVVQIDRGAVVDAVLNAVVHVVEPIAVLPGK